MPELCEGNIGAAVVASPEYSSTSSSAPADSKLKRKASYAWVILFVICRCMSRLHWQIPASFDHYPENGTGWLYWVKSSRSIQA